MKTIKMSNGVSIPMIGFGSWQIPAGDETVNAVTTAINKGYRLIDTAPGYRNEIDVGKAVAECGIAREEIFVTSKVYNTERGYLKTKAAFEKSLKDLGLDYFDLYLIHWPAAANQFENWEEINVETWRAITEMYKAGKVRAIGVSNFKPHHLKALMETEVKPMINQIEFHPGQLQTDVREYCQSNGILLEAWSPLGNGKMLTNPQLVEIAGHYGKTVAQLCIRWCIQHDVIPIIKTVKPSRMDENYDVNDFEITPEDMNKIDNMEYFAGTGFDPDNIWF